MMGLTKKLSEHDERKEIIDNYVENFWFINITEKQSNSTVRDKVFKLLDSIFKTRQIPATHCDANNSLNESVNSIGAQS